MNYLNYKFEDNEKFISTFDEAPLWSAAFGLLLLKNLQLNSGITVLDIGCGTGFPLLELAGRLDPGSKLYGIDPWKNAIARAKIKIENYGYRNVELFESSAAQIPLENDSVDVAVSNLGINNFDNPGTVFKECNRVLKPGGRLALTSNLNGHWKLFYEIFESALRGLNRLQYLPALAEQQKHRGNADSFSELFTGNRFRNIKIVHDVLQMNFANGTAFLNHHFVKLGWLSSWLEIFPSDERREVFDELEKQLNEYALRNNGLKLQVPMIYAEGIK